MRKAAAVRLVAATLAVTLAGGACARSSSTTSGVPDLAATRRNCGHGILEEGKIVPSDCVVQAFGTGRSETIGSVRGNAPMVLNFWASWCVYCIKEMPDLQRAYERIAGKVSFAGLDLLGVQGETPGAAASLARRTGVKYPLAYDRDGLLYHRVCPCGGRPLMPTTIFVGSDGTIRFIKFGPLTANELRSLIRDHLGVEV